MPSQSLPFPAAAPPRSYEEYRGAKELVLLDGQDHNSQRPRWFQDRAGIFLRQALHIPDEVSAPRPPAVKFALQPPPPFATRAPRTACPYHAALLLQRCGSASQLPLYREFGFESLPETLGVAWTRAIRAGSVSHRPPPGHTVVGLGSTPKPAGAAAPTAAVAGGSSAEATAADAGAAGPVGGIDASLAGGDGAHEMEEPFDPVAFAIEQSKLTAAQDELRRQLAASEEAAAAAAPGGDAGRAGRGAAPAGASGDGKGALSAGKPRATPTQAPQPWLVRRASSAAAVTMAAAESERDVRGSERAMQDFGRLRTVDSATPPLPAEEEEEDDELQQAIRRSLEEHQPTLPGRASDPPESPRLEEAHVPHGGEVADEAADAAEAAAEAANAADATTSPGE